MELPNKQIILKNYVQGCPKETDFELKMGVASTQIPEGSRGVFVKNIYLACDPYMCHLMRPQRKSLFVLTSFVPGTVIKGCGVAKVIKSAYPELKEGDYVWGLIGWEEFSLVLDPEKILHKINNKDVPLSYYAGILAGGVGHLVGQFAKMMGCYVVGSASTQEKVNLLKTKLGFDDAFTYKEGDDALPKGIDIYFDNVAGMLDEYGEWAVQKLQEKKLIYLQDVAIV
ncbi:2-alkenal reductase (NADP(+)-dependent) [Sesamum alatum]|uniref:2-alkenal reductase (NADP(+)-dependent) n=1 Tax=Sesamum alatum TaxID=300844 RepID=A0AAE1YHB3_9LAMI|nr:2-alkenal reductase (NADP(+)-dependent) [Sesamum alatum]